MAYRSKSKRSTKRSLKKSSPKKYFKKHLACKSITKKTAQKMSTSQVLKTAAMLEYSARAATAKAKHCLAVRTKLLNNSL